jgi:hypothetical protein
MVNMASRVERIMSAMLLILPAHITAQSALPLMTVSSF